MIIFEETSFKYPFWDGKFQPTHPLNNSRSLRYISLYLDCSLMLELQFICWLDNLKSQVFFSLRNSPVFRWSIPMKSRCFLYYPFYVCKITVIYVSKKFIASSSSCQLLAFEIYLSQYVSCSDLLVIFVNLS